MDHSVMVLAWSICTDGEQVDWLESGERWIFAPLAWPCDAFGRKRTFKLQEKLSVFPVRGAVDLKIFHYNLNLNIFISTNLGCLNNNFTYKVKFVYLHQVFNSTWVIQTHILGIPFLLELLVAWISNTWSCFHSGLPITLLVIFTLFVFQLGSPGLSNHLCRFAHWKGLCLLLPTFFHQALNFNFNTNCCVKVEILTSMHITNMHNVNSNDSLLTWIS